MVFGTAVNYQALQINKAVKGTTLAGVGVLSGMDLWSALPDGADDGQFKLSLLQMLIQINHLKKVLNCWAPSFHPPVDAKKAASLQKQIDSLQSQVNQAVAKQAQQVACTLARRNLQINDANAKGLGANPVQHPRRRGLSAEPDHHHQRQRRACSPGTSRRTCSTSTAACIRPTTPRPLPPLPLRPRSRPSA